MKSTILFLIYVSMSYGQVGKYFEQKSSCTGASTINQYSCLYLQDEQKFTFQLFYIDEKEECKKIVGNWRISNDTLYLTTTENKYYYLVEKGTILSPDKNAFHLIMTNKEKEIKNYGIDNFGLGVTKLLKMEAVLKDVDEEYKKHLLERINKSCR